MKFLSVFFSRAALAGAATVLVPMAVSARHSMPSGGGETVHGSFTFLVWIFSFVGYCLIGVAIACDSPKMTRLGFLFMTIGLAIFFSRLDFLFVTIGLAIFLLR